MSPRPLQSEGGPGQFGCLALFFSPFLIAGLVAFFAGVSDGSKDLGERIGLAAFSLLFVGVGGGGMYWAIRSMRQARREIDFDSAQHAESWLKLIPKLKTKRGMHGGIALPSESSRFANMIGLGIFSLIWNGVVVGIFIGWSNERGGDRTILLIFGIIFGLFGLLILAGFVTETLKYFGTGDTIIEVPEEPLQPGASSMFRLTQGGAFAINSAKVILECRERVTFRRGTDTVTVHETVFEQEIAEVRDTAARDGMPLIDAEFKIPTDAPHSWMASNNSIEWRLRLVMDIPGKPDLDERYQFRVLPREIDPSQLPERRETNVATNGEWNG